MKTRLLIMLILILPLLGKAQSSALNEYIELGLAGNLALRQQEFSLQSGLEALKEARGLFLPSVSLQARYSRAGGGRLIEIPIGTLMNPVFSSLNQLYGLHGLPAGFPTDLPDEVVPFLREKEQETKIRIVQPLFQPALYHNYKLKSTLSQVKQAELEAFKRQLIGEIKAAYFTCARTRSVVDLLDKTRLLLEENLRVSKSLFDNGKATEDVIFRARAELSALDQKRAEAEKNRRLSAQYFNFLLNRDLDSTIRIEPLDLPLPEAEPDLKAAETHAMEHREEFRQLREAIEAGRHRINLEGSAHLPTVTAVFDWGIQGETYSLRSDDDFWMASLVLEWNVFDGFQAKARKAQARLDRQKLLVQQKELERQIELQVQEAFYALRAAREAVRAAEAQKASAERSFSIVARKFEYGTAPQVEYLDAQTTLTNASVNLILAVADYHIKHSEFEKAAAFSALRPDNN